MQFTTVWRIFQIWDKKKNLKSYIVILNSKDVLERETHLLNVFTGWYIYKNN